MGAYLLYKLINPGQATEACAFLDAQPEQKQLNQYHRGIWFWTPEDREYELKRLKETGCGAPDFMKIGEGIWKASGLSLEEEPCYELVAQLFKKLHTKYQIKIYRGSCALKNDYFTKEQIRMITRNGEALSSKKTFWEFRSKSNPDKHYQVKYQEYNGGYRLRCSCPSWIYNHRKDRTCKHTDSIVGMGNPYFVKKLPK